ncbi:heme-copper oxidase subunit III [Caenimonas terrae]|uniref:Heme-copper oxidase subunit III n=1 Tax=Caenimonas terrae TaxID=696074 RepID=A0ABW0NHD5_9BURK
MRAEAILPSEPALPVGSKGRLSSGWWGMWTLVATEAALFAYLLFSYFYVASQTVGAWPPSGPPKLGIALPDTFILLAGSLTMWLGERGVRKGRRGQLLLGIAATLVLGVVFLGLQLIEWRNKPFSLHTNAYGSLYFTVTGFHMAHVVIGLLMLAVLFVWTLLGYFDERRHSAVSTGALYWHFVTAVWIAVFLSLYVVPQFG